MEQQYVIDTLANHGFTSEHYSQGIEAGSEDWMGIVEDITNENPYEGLSEQGNNITLQFIRVMGELGIELW